MGIKKQDHGQLEIKFDQSDLPVENIHVQITSRINEHVAAVITGMMQCDIYDQYVDQATSLSQIHIEYQKNRKAALLYTGIITYISAQAQGGGKDNSVYNITIHALSYTYLMDIVLKSRSFQDVNMAYDAFLSEICKEYGAIFYNCAAEDQKLKQFVLQYRSTDWDFLKRVASKFEQGLFADAKAAVPRFRFGIAEGKDRGTLTSFEYTIAKQLGTYRNYEENKYVSHTSELDFLEYKILDRFADKTFALSDKLLYADKSLYISEVYSEIKDYELYNTYRLKTKNGLKKPQLQNTTIQGISLPGKVLAAENNQVKIHLDVDQFQKVDTAFWFECATFYATFYAMPEIGDYVCLYMPTLDETDSIILNSLKQDPEGGYTRNNAVHTSRNTSAAGIPSAINFAAAASDPAVKLLTTKAGHMIQLGPDNVTIQFDENNYLVLHDSQGIALYSNQDISLHATGNIQAVAEENIMLIADEKITIRNQKSAIEIEPASIKIKSKDIRMN